ncbi:MAG TPA: hypothetical protein VNT81_01990 [Vicinamibacterales bacterium]|nr:hypothetical protein [Vicinamibacterales bacterium]
MSRSRLDDITNLILCVTCVVVVALLGYRTLTERDTTARLPPTYANGDVMPAINGVDYSVSDKTLLVMVSSTCRYCTESMPFYSQLAKISQTGRFQIVMAGYESVESLKSYASAHGVVIDRIVSVPAEVRIGATPTLLLIDRSGRVASSWLGALRGREKDVIARL